MPLVWELPDGSVRTTRLTPEFLAAHRQDGESTGAAVTRLAEVVRRKNPDLASATLRVLPSAALPPKDADRDCWRLEGDRVVVHPGLKRAKPPKPATLEERITALEARLR